jgi:hypothetical protein
MDLMATIPSLIGHKLDKNNMVDTEDASELFIKESSACTPGFPGINFHFPILSDKSPPLFWENLVYRLNFII